MATPTGRLRIWLTTLAVAGGVCPAARAAQHVTLRNGFELDCAHQVAVGDKIRFYLSAGEDGSFLEVKAAEVARVEDVPEATPAKANPVQEQGGVQAVTLDELLQAAGARHNVDADLLASVVRAESGGQVRAVSRTGARGLMQLMPGTANELGVKDAFVPEQNIAGGTAYLDALLTRYHDDVVLAVAAYNAGPAAVDRYHGVPPYRETRAYVARVVREFNRRKQAEMVARGR